jgi:hypothetical protein
VDALQEHGSPVTTASPARQSTTASTDRLNIQQIPAFVENLDIVEIRARLGRIVCNGDRGAGAYP